MFQRLKALILAEVHFKLPGCYDKNRKKGNASIFSDEYQMLPFLTLSHLFMFLFVIVVLLASFLTASFSRFHPQSQDWIVR